MAPSVSLNVPFEAPLSRKSPSLALQVQQIISQRGAFRNLSEGTLQAEVNGTSKAPEDDEGKQDVQIESEASETTEARTESLLKNRAEMLQRLDYAQMEILSALDFVSLLLSNHSEAAKSSMSPALKDAAPTGSIDMRKVREKQSSRAASKRLQAVGQSWKANKFETASQKLNVSSERLSKEAILQSKYWQQIASLKAQGWLISRLPHDSRAIVAHYGFSEATPHYRNRGFALLQQNDDGSLHISQPSISPKSKLIRVIVVRKGDVTGTSTAHLRKPSELNGIQNQLIDARDALLDEELFYEIGREARLIANQGVALHSHAVEIVISQDYALRIIQGEQNDQEQVSKSSGDNALANFVGTSLRLMLLREHELSYQRRSSQKPLPLSQAPRPTQEYAILRPLIAQLRHYALVSEILESTEKYGKMLTTAGMSLAAEPRLLSDKTQPLLDVSSLRLPAKSSIHISLPSGKDLKIDLETYLASPIYGTLIRADPLEYSFSILNLTPTHALSEYEAFEQEAIALDLVETILQTKMESLEWTASSTQPGELILSKDREKLVKLKIRCTTSGLSLSVLHKNDSSKQMYEWTSDGAWQITHAGQRDEIKKSFSDVVSELSSVEA